MTCGALHRLHDGDRGERHDEVNRRLDLNLVRVEGLSHHRAAANALAAGAARPVAGGRNFPAAGRIAVFLPRGAMPATNAAGLRRAYAADVRRSLP